MLTDYYHLIEPGLTWRQRGVFDWHVREEYTLWETAEILCVSLRTVKYEWKEIKARLHAAQRQQTTPVSCDITIERNGKVESLCDETLNSVLNK